MAATNNKLVTEFGVFDVPEQHVETLSQDEKQFIKAKIKKLLKQQNAVLVAHYYVDAELQMLADETGGVVSDSLDMARFGNEHPASTLIVAGVRFMGETAKILNPEKRVLMPDINAECSLDLLCPADAFAKFRAEHPDRTAVVYANTSVEVKALSDWVVTSSIALDVAEYLKSRGEKILWAPDKHLGGYIKETTGADMLLWDGACIVHESFQSEALEVLSQQYPDAVIIAHPESPRAVLELAQVVGSTSQLLDAVINLPAKQFIVATDRGIFHKMREMAPGKLLLEAPTGGKGATCQSCAHCPWMSLNSLQKVLDCLEQGSGEILVDESVRKGALAPLQCMMDFGKSQNKSVAGDA